MNIFSTVAAKASQSAFPGFQRGFGALVFTGMVWRILMTTCCVGSVGRGLKSFVWLVVRHKTVCEKGIDISLHFLCLRR